MLLSSIGSLIPEAKAALGRSVVAAAIAEPWRAMLRKSLLVVICKSSYV
jgi:hypothetical protein